MGDEQLTSRAGPPGPISALLAELARGPPSRRPPPVLRAGAVIAGRFELVRELGRGGFGVVWEARDRLLGRSVAFKAVDAPVGRVDGADRHHEAEAVACLAHPNIVQIFDAGVAEESPYLILELLEGETLQARLERGPLPPAQALAVATEVAKALACAHRAGVLHRDLKPSNVFLARDGAVKVLDFGLARLLRHGAAPGGGTPAYMSPEQRRGAPEDERTDVYALGLLLLRMIAGLPPDDVEEAPRAVARAVAPPFLATLDRMLCEDPRRRPRDGTAALAALVAAGPPSLRVRGLRPRSRAALATAAVVVTLAVAAAAIAWRARAPPAPGERLVVAVADVANETGDRDLAAISGLLVTSLEQSRRLSVLSRGRMLDVAQQLGQGGVTQIDERLGREIARAAGAEALLLSSIHRFDDVYAMELRAVAPDGDGHLFSVKGKVTGRAAIPDLVDRLSEEARLALRERDAELAASRTRTREALTPSLEAYRHYFEATQLEDTAFDFPRALAGYKRALEADPEFALPHLQIAIMADWHEAPEEDPALHLAEAARRAPRLPEKERKLILAWKARHEGRFAEAIPLARELAAAHPLDKQVLYLAGEIAWHGGRPGGADEAAAEFARALDLDPTYLVAMVHLFPWRARRGAADEAIARARRAVELHPGPMALAMLARAHGLAGHVEEAVAQARRAAALAEGAHFEVSYALAEVLWWAGHREEAEAELLGALRRGATAGERRLALELLPVALAADGRRREALARHAGLAETGCGARCEAFDEVLKVHLLLAGGDLARAREALARWRPATDAEAAPHAWLWPYLGLAEEGEARGARLAPGTLFERRYAGAAALRRGDAAAAVEILSAIAPLDPDLETEFLLAEALLAAGREREALAPLAKVASAYPLYAPRWQASFRAWSVYLLARTHARLGERELARAAIARLLGDWRRADPDLPLLADARALARELGVPRAPR